MPEAAGLLEIEDKGVNEKSGKRYVKLNVGQMKIWCWEDRCDTPLDDVEAMVDKLVSVKYEDNRSGTITYHNARTVELVPESEKAAVTATLANGSQIRERGIIGVAVAKSMIEQGKHPKKDREEFFFWCANIEEYAHCIGIVIKEFSLPEEPPRSQEDIDLTAYSGKPWKNDPPRSQEDIQQGKDTIIKEIKKLADGQTIRNAMDKLGYDEVKLSDCDAGKLVEIRDKIKDSMLV